MRIKTDTRNILQIRSKPQYQIDGDDILIGVTAAPVLYRIPQIIARKGYEEFGAILKQCDREYAAKSNVVKLGIEPDEHITPIDHELQPALARDAFSGLCHMVGTMDQDATITARELVGILKLIEQAGCCVDS